MAMAIEVFRCFEYIGTQFVKKFDFDIKYFYISFCWTSLILLNFHNHFFIKKVAELDMQSGKSF